MRKGPMERFHAELEKRDHRIRELEALLAETNRDKKAAEARNKYMEELLGRQGSMIVVKDQEILFLRNQLADQLQT